MDEVTNDEAQRAQTGASIASIRDDVAVIVDILLGLGDWLLVRAFGFDESDEVPF